MALTSRHNATVQLCRSLQQAAGRREHGLYLLEGLNGVEEAVRHHVPLHVVLWSPALAEQERGQGLLRELERQQAPLQPVAAHLIDYVASTDTPQGVVAVAALPQHEFGTVVGPGRWAVLLDGVSDPGNVGTIIRTAAAAGADGVLLWGASCDAWNPKSVRASAGVASWFPVLRLDSLADLAGSTLLATSSHVGRPYSDVEYRAGGVLAIGSEAHGVCAEVAERVQHWIRIPLSAGVESLNAAVAAAVVLFHARRSRENNPENGAVGA